MMKALGKERTNTVYTVTANCQDCYRCVRACPVKAIRVQGGQAFVEDALCIKCGTCVRECPQNAKTIRSGLDTVRAYLAAGDTVVASVAPSFAAAYHGWRASRLPSVLRMLGFAHVTETAEGADAITAESFKGKKGSICTACPAVVNYIERYRPEHIGRLIPVVSPMIAHGKLLKMRYGETAKVIFIGPCAAKKEEACRTEFEGIIDEVLTFSELNDWITEEGIDLANIPESQFEPAEFSENARLFPLQGGMLKTAGIGADGTEERIVHVSGAEEVMELLSCPSREWSLEVAEPLFCRGGCIGGPAFPKEHNLFERRRSVIEYAKNAVHFSGEGQFDGLKLETEFEKQDYRVAAQDISEEKINEVLAATGKLDIADRLNCGACGYKSCLENAVAVVRGLAETEMCMPYMRKMAHQRTDKIIETSLSGVVVLDSELKILKMNPAFCKMFMCNNSILGKPISYLVSADGYEKIRSGSEDKAETIRVKYGMKYHELCYAIRDEGQYVGMYTDITKLKFDEKQIDLIKNQTLAHAKDLLDHQIRFSQEMAHYLGKSAAHSEELLSRLIHLYEEDE